MEKRYQSIDQDLVNAELFGNDMKINPNPDSIRIPFLTAFKHNLEMKIINAKNDADLNAIGLMLNEATDKHYDIDILDYQFKAARKMTQIENKPKYNIN
jgi:hypothetical protein